MDMDMSMSMGITHARMSSMLMVDMDGMMKRLNRHVLTWPHDKADEGRLGFKWHELSTPQSDPTRRHMTTSGNMMIGGNMIHTLCQRL